MSCLALTGQALEAAVVWWRGVEYDSELGPLLAGVSQHAWGAWSEGLVTVRETCEGDPPCTYAPDLVSLGCPCPLLEEWPPGDGLQWGICG